MGIFDSLRSYTNKYKKVNFDPEKMKVEARLYFQESDLNSKVFFRVVPQRNRYRFKEHEFIEIYINDIFIARGRDETLSLYNTICTDIPEIDFKTFPYFTVKQKKEIVYTVKVLVSGELVLFMGDLQTLFFVTNSIETIRKIVPEDSDYKYIINGKEIYTISSEAIDKFSDII